MINDNFPFRLERFREYIEALFLQEPEIYGYDSKIEGLPKIAVFVYKNVPEEGYSTALTYGLSEYDNPNWKEGRPELCISVNSLDTTWETVLGFIAVEFQTELDFSYGEIIDLEEPISEESSMSAFFVFAPSIFDSEDYADIDLTYYKVNLVSLYPIYQEEIPVIGKIGLKKFMCNDNYDMYNIGRQKILK